MSQIGTQSQGEEELLVKRLVRYCLLSEYKHSTIKRDELSKKIGTTAKNSQVVFDKAQRILKNTFGFELVHLDNVFSTTKTDTNASRKNLAAKQGTVSNRYCLLRMGDASIGPNFHDQSYGFLVFLIAILYLNGQTSHPHLVEILRKFDLAFDQPGEIDLNECINEFIRQKYLVKSNLESAEYELGPRALAEFPADRVKKIIGEYLGDDSLIEMFE